jgi:hypothetical protein
MVLVSHRYKFIYVKNMKSAGTSVECFFEKYCSDPSISLNIRENKKTCEITPYGIIGTRSFLNDSSTWYNHMDCTTIKSRIGDEIFNEYLKFCVVRNPYDKVVSSYNFFKKLGELEGVEFEEYCARPLKILKNLYTINGKVECDYFIRYEHLKFDIIELCGKLGIQNININELPTYKSQFRDHSISYRDYYKNERIKKLIYEKFKDEFELFNYTF